MSRAWPDASAVVSWLCVLPSVPIETRKEPPRAPAGILRCLVSAVARQGGSVVAVADGENLAVSLNKYSVNRGNAVAEWCAYESAATERRVQCSVGGIAR